MSKRYTISIPEKGDIEQIEHFLKCTEQAEKRADKSWVKQACYYRRQMLIKQLADMKKTR